MKIIISEVMKKDLEDLRDKCNENDFCYQCTDEEVLACKKIHGKAGKKIYELTDKELEELADVVRREKNIM